MIPLQIKNGKYNIYRQYSPKKGAVQAETQTVVSDCGDISGDIGKWVHWDIYVKFSYSDFFDPYLSVFKDGVLIYQSTKANYVNSPRGSFFKVGPYPVNYVNNPSQIQSTSRTMLVDNIVFTN